MTNLTQFAQTHRARLEAVLEQCVKPAPSRWAAAATTFDSHHIYNAMRYSLCGGGKRLRALLVYASYQTLSKQPIHAGIDALAAALECLHAYSLIHDDLPAMDDDDLRRGKAANHIKFGEATAILAGDALQALAFELLADAELPPPQLAAALKTLACAAGAAGMVGGQQFDLLSGKQNDKPGTTVQPAFTQNRRTYSGRAAAWCLRRQCRRQRTGRYRPVRPAPGAGLSGSG